MKPAISKRKFRRFNAPRTTEAIKEAMLACGSIAAAARELAVYPAAIYKRVARSPELQEVARLIRKPGTRESGKRRRPSPNDDSAIVEALRAHERTLTESGLAKIGVDPEVAEQTIAMAQAFQDHFRQIRCVTGGGLVKLYLNCLHESEQATADIHALDQAPLEQHETRESRLGRLKMLREDRLQLCSFVLETFDRLRQAQLTAAMIELKASQPTRDSRQIKRVPAFPPLMAVRTAPQSGVPKAGEDSPPPSPNPGSVEAMAEHTPLEIRRPPNPNCLTRNPNLT